MDGEQLGCGNMGRTVWLQLYPYNSDVPLIFETAGSSFDTAIAVYEFPSYETPVSDYTRVACSEGGQGQQADIEFNVEPGKMYVVQLGGRNGASGDMQVNGRCETYCPPQNDHLRFAEQTCVSCGHAADTRGATLEPGEMQPCGNIGKTVWFSLQPGAVDYNFRTEGSEFPAAIAVYRFEGASPPGALRMLECSSTGSLDIAVEDGFGYLVQVGGVDGASGMLNFQANCTDRCPPGLFPVPVDTGGAGQPGGGVRPPDTGNGGYLPRSRRGAAP
jgi:hypothetical protein